MEQKIRLEHLSLAEAAALLGAIAEELAEGVLSAEGGEIRVTAPVTLSVELDASHTAAHATISLQCNRPDGVSRLLQEEMARPGG